MTTHGHRVLVVEDEAVLATQIQNLLFNAGLRVVGPAASKADAMRLAHNEVFEFALLDVNLAGEKVFPVADILVARGIRFVFLSAHSRAILPVRYKGALLIEKPYHPDALLQTIRQMLGISGLWRAVDRSLAVEHLRQADANITAARDRLARQSALIDRLVEHGHDAVMARSLHQTMTETLAVLESQRLIILRELQVQAPNGAH